MNNRDWTPRTESLYHKRRMEILRNCDVAKSGSMARALRYLKALATKAIMAVVLIALVFVMTPIVLGWLAFIFGGMIAMSIAGYIFLKKISLEIKKEEKEDQS